MKKIITLVLALALVLTSVVAIAEAVEAPAAPKGTPNVNSFATMKTKYNEGAGVITITLSKPVDRLLVNWAEKGAEPEELAVGEDLKATALTWGHKYMPGTEQKYVTEIDGVTLNNKNTVSYTAQVIGYDIPSSEVVYKTGSKKSPSYMNGNTVAFVYEANFPKVELLPYGTGKGESPLTVSDQIASYKSQYPGLNYDIVLPHSYTPVGGGKTVTVNGYIQLESIITNGIDPESIQAVEATPAQTAYMTVQGEWAVYYNRAGKIVGIELFDGQF